MLLTQNNDQILTLRHFIFIAVFVLGIQSLILIVLLLKHRKKNSTFKFLGILLLFFILSLLNYCVFHILRTWEIPNYIPYFNLELMYGLGPSLYLYTNSLTDSKFRFKKVHLLHFALPLLEFIYYRTSFFRDGVINLSDNTQSNLNLIFKLIVWGGFVSISVYLILSTSTIIKYKRWVWDNFSNIENKQLLWFERPAFCYIIFWFIWIPLRLIDIYIFDQSLTVYYFDLAFLLLAIITTWIGFRGYINSQNVSDGFLTLKTHTQHKDYDPSELQKIAQDLKHKMSIEKYYLDSELTLTKLATYTDYTPRLISKSLNSSLDVSFHKFVNAYRVEEFKNNIKSDTYAHLSLYGVALESGFGSKSNFNLVFKSITGLTPNEYRIQNLKKES